CVLLSLFMYVLFLCSLLSIFYLFRILLLFLFFFLIIRPPPRSTLFPYTTLFRSALILWIFRVLYNSCRQSKVLSGAIHPYLLRRSEEHTSELQSRFDLVCRLLLEKKKKKNQYIKKKNTVDDLSIHLEYNMMLTVI